MHTGKHAAALAASLFAATALFTTTIFAAPAQAQPTGCSGGTSNPTGTGGTAWYYCSGGDGQYAFSYRVKHPNPQVDAWLYGYRTECVSPGQLLQFGYTWGQREVVAAVFC
ncbi:hypothetical protein [Streptosporangium saharense]|uniref:hypothetical protein n=1 Tax=Streptosporangium saharense TaxID=1706840 RepID=UPI00343E707E